MNYFSITHQDTASKARSGKLVLAHAIVETPVFMPVGTQGTVKNMSADELLNLPSNLILGNTYHLYLRPGMEVLAQAQGLHNFANWPGNLLTDSGGFQVFSLAEKMKLSEEGVTFYSHIDGSKHFFSPEKVVEIQRIIGSDIMMPLDECLMHTASYQYAMDSTHAGSLEQKIPWLLPRNTMPMSNKNFILLKVVCIKICGRCLVILLANREL